MQDKKVRFIRKNGRIIPIIDKGGQKLPEVKRVFSEKTQKIVSGIGAVAGGAVGLKKGSLISGFLGATIGGYLGALSTNMRTTKLAKGEPNEFGAARVAIGNKNFLKAIKNGEFKKGW